MAGRRRDRRRNRINIRELFSKDEGYDDECIEDRFKREKDEMLAIIMEKDLKIESLTQKKDELEKQIIKKDESLKKFQDSHTTLLLEVSKTQKERWLILNQVDKKRGTKGSHTWKSVREEAQNK